MFVLQLLGACIATPSAWDDKPLSSSTHYMVSVYVAAHQALGLGSGHEARIVSIILLQHAGVPGLANSPLGRLGPVVFFFTSISMDFPFIDFDAHLATHSRHATKQPGITRWCKASELSCVPGLLL